MPEASGGKSSKSKFGLALLLFALILGGVGVWYGWIRPFAARTGPQVEIGLRIDAYRMMKDLHIR